MDVRQKFLMNLIVWKFGNYRLFCTLSKGESGNVRFPNKIRADQSNPLFCALLRLSLLASSDSPLAVLMNDGTCTFKLCSVDVVDTAANKATNEKL